ncbi:MAG: ABC transporter permease [Phycisphaeraceae bacterium]|nr:ABC transporter permease [Phycisphaeraceae bacterium]
MIATSHRSSSGSGRTFLSRLFRAQESGLILVIFLMAAVLTLRGGTKPGDTARVTLPEGTTTEEVAGVLVVQSPSATPLNQVRAVLGDSKPSGANLRILSGSEKLEAFSASNPRIIKGTNGPTLLVSPSESKFLNTQNLVLLATQASFIAVMAVGMTAVIILGGIDLSVGSIYGLAAVVGAFALKALQMRVLGPEANSLDAAAGGAPWYLAIPVGIGVCCLVGAACGGASGAMIVGLRVHPFIITLGMMAMLSGLVFVLTRGQSITGFPESFTRGFMKMPAGNVYPVPVAIMVVTMLGGMFVLSQTVLGRRIFAIGGNEIAAKYAGIPVGGVKILVYVAMGALAGLSAAMYLGYYGAAAPGAGQGYELDVIAAAVIGGASLSGGRGSAFGAVLGALLVQMIGNGMLVLDIDQSYTQIVKGAAIVVAVVLDQAKARLTPGAR